MTSFLLVGSYQETANGHSWRRVHPFVGWRYSDTARSGPIVTCLSIFQCKGRFAMRYEPLSRFPALRTRDVDELRQRMSGLFSVRSMDLGRGARRTFEGRLNHRQLRDVGMSYARYGAALTASLSHGDSYIQGFPLRGQGSYVLNGSEGGTSPGHGIFCGPGADLRLEYSSDFE